MMLDYGDEEVVVEVAGVGESDCLVESRKESGKSVTGDPDRQKPSQRNVDRSTQIDPS